VRGLGPRSQGPANAARADDDRADDGPHEAQPRSGAQEGSPRYDRPRLEAILVPPRVQFLATCGPGGAVHCRPVVIWTDPTVWGDGRDGIPVHFLTGHDAHKLRDIASHPRVSLSAVLHGGCFSAEGTAERVRDIRIARRVWRDLVGPAPMPANAISLVRMQLTQAREWTVRSGAPFDNSVRELLTPMPSES
jgi:general stress protein 26